MVQDAVGHRVTAVGDAVGDRLRDASALWNAHRFFDVHETLEDAWRLVKHEKKAEPAADPRRDALQGLILYAAAYLHWQRGNAVGVSRKLADARQLFRTGRPAPAGWNLASFRARVEVDLQRAALGEPFDPQRVPTWDLRVA